METKRFLRRVGKALLALVCGVLTPVLIWVALGAAVTWILRDRKAKQATVRHTGVALATIRN